MSHHAKRYQRRKSSTDMMKQQREAHLKEKEARRKSTVAKLWNWLGTKKEEEEREKKGEQEVKPVKPKRVAKKAQKAHTVAVVDSHRRIEEDWSDASSDGEAHPAPPPLHRHHIGHAATVPLTPPRTPDRPVGCIVEEEEISPSHAKALEASRNDYDDTSSIEQKLTNLEPSSHKHHSKSKSRSSGGARPKQPQESGKSSRSSEKGSKRRRKKRTGEISTEVDTSVPLDWPATPETVLNYHKRKSFLTPNEEWLIMELHEFECLLESMDMVHKIAKFSKFFELDPPELLEEFFEFAEEIPSYDEVINSDIWQEFRDVRYPY